MAEFAALPRLDRHGELLDVGRLEEGGVKREWTNKLRKL